MTLLDKKSVVVFDLDGTLVDSMLFFGDIAATVLEQSHGADYAYALENYRRTCGLPFDYQLEAIYPDDPRNLVALREFDRLKKESYYQCSFFNDVPEVFALLRKKGLKLAVSSNNEQSIVESRFESVGGLDLILGFRKPDFLKGKPHFSEISNKFSVQPSDILFIGDSLHDATMAQECGVDFVGREGTFTRQEFDDQSIAASVVISLKELLL